jgi:hypothetical protein
MSTENNPIDDPSTNGSTGHHVIQKDCSIQKGTTLYYVKDLNLAACLISLGIKLRSDPPVLHFKRPDGREDVTFSFTEATEDGKFLTAEMIKAYKNDAKFIQHNPDHPMSYLIAAVKNLVSLKNSLAKSIPYLAFRATKDSGVTIYVQEGTKKHQNCLAKGMVHVDTTQKV